MSGPRRLHRHLNSTVSKTMFTQSIIVSCILCIVNEQISSLHKGQKFRFTAITPFYVSRIDNPVTSVFHTIDHRSVEWMTAGKFCQDTDLLRTLLTIMKPVYPGFTTFRVPGNIEIIRHCMERTL